MKGKSYQRNMQSINGCTISNVMHNPLANMPVLTARDPAPWARRNTHIELSLVLHRLQLLFSGENSILEIVNGDLLILNLVKKKKKVKTKLPNRKLNQVNAYTICAV